MAFFDNLSRFADNTLLVTEEGLTFSYADVVRRGEIILSGIAERPLIFLCAANSVDMVACYIHCLQRHWPVVLTAAQDQELFDRQVTLYDPSVILHPDADGVKVEIRHDRSINMHEDLCVLLSTSGSTGSPKMVKLSVENIDSNAHSIAEYLALTQHDRGVTALKFNYSYGMSVINSALATGGSLLVTERAVTDEAFWDGFIEQACTNFPGVPYSFEMLARMGDRLAHCSALRFMTQAGGKLAPELVQKLAALGKEQGWQFFVMYGQTEASPRIAYLPPELACKYPAAIGRAIPGGAIDIVGSDGNALQAPGAEGELRYKGPNIFIGYAENQAGLAGSQTYDCLMTGDIARWNEAGLIEIVGRSSRFVKPFGLRVNLADVETEAGAYAHGVIATGTDELIVIAVPEESWTQGCDDTIRTRLSVAYKLPPTIFTILKISSVPRLANGKTDYRAILAMSASVLHDRNARHAPVRSARTQWVITRNQLLTMLASGLWHGAAWTFVSWGVVHGFLLIIQRQIGSRIRALYPQTGLFARGSIAAQITIVFIAVAATRILFRAPDLDRAARVFENIWAGPYDWSSLDAKPKLAICFALILSVTMCEIGAENGIWRRLFRKRRWLRCLAVLMIFLVTLVLGDFEGGRFVYVRF
jgi:hypothetical protein